MAKVSDVMRWSALAAVVLVLVTGCGSLQEIKLDIDDNNRQIEIKTGQTLVITLDSNPTTGFKWERVTTEDKTLQQIGEADYTQDPQGKDMVGVGGQETLRFKAEQAGQTTLELVYHQPWETEAKPAETFVVQVVVR